jgi:hypothetical protein
LLSIRRYARKVLHLPRSSFDTEQPFGPGAAFHRGENYLQGVPGPNSGSTFSRAVLQHTADDASLIYIKFGRNTDLSVAPLSLATIG